MATPGARPPLGPAHVAVVSFLAARAAPTGGFWIALAGGVALARVAERRGARLGFGASAAAMLETVAIIGPARFGIPLTQALTAPMLGRLEARGGGLSPQILACAAVRLIHNTATTAFFIWVITGGLDAYAGTYDAIGRRVGIEVGTADALVLTLAEPAGLGGLRQHGPGARLPARPGALGREPDEAPERWWPRTRAATRGRPTAGRFDPRAVASAPPLPSCCCWSSTSWALLRPWRPGSRGRLAAPGPTEPLPAACVRRGARRRRLRFGLGGGLGLDVAARRALRAGLLVLTATWLRGAAGRRRPAGGVAAALGTASGDAVGARGRRGARPDRLGGPAGGGRPGAGASAARRAQARRCRSSTPCSAGWSREASEVAARRPRGAPRRSTRALATGVAAGPGCRAGPWRSR